jgi:hypothetical protein
MKKYFFPAFLFFLLGAIFLILKYNQAVLGLALVSFSDPCINFVAKILSFVSLQEASVFKATHNYRFIQQQFFMIIFLLAIIPLLTNLLIKFGKIKANIIMTQWVAIITLFLFTFLVIPQQEQYSLKNQVTTVSVSSK